MRERLTDDLRAVLNEICIDSLEGTLESVLAYPDEGNVSDMFWRAAELVDALAARLAAVETERNVQAKRADDLEARWHNSRAERDEARQALQQACMNLGTIRPLDMLREGESDISIGEAADRWRDLVIEQSALPVAARPETDAR